MINDRINDSRAYAAEAVEYCALADKALVKSDALILNGYHCGMKVCNGALHIQPGSVNGEVKEPVLYYRGTANIRQIIITSNSGNISLDAFYWCRDQGISLLLLDGHGNQVYSITPENKDSAPLRRSQYLASGAERGVQIALSLVHEKTLSQIDTASKHPELKKCDRLLRLLEQSEWELSHPDDRFFDVGYLRLYEGRLAASYFDAFVGLPLQWKTADAKIVPPHWKAITGRSSPVSTNGNGRHAINPFQAALNYLYTVAEHHVLVAIQQVGLDPACGFLHTDRENRDSLVYDLIEPFRPRIDDLALRFFRKTVMKKGDLVLQPSGQILLNAEFARYVLASCNMSSWNFVKAAVEVKGFLSD